MLCLVHLDPEGGSGGAGRSEAMERKARTVPNKVKTKKKGAGCGGGGGGGRSSGSSDGVGGRYPLTRSVFCAVVAALKDIEPMSVLIAAHGKGKSDGAAALMDYMKQHVPELTDRITGLGLINPKRIERSLP